MPGLSEIGTLSYNGYSFDGSSKVKVQTEFVLDESRRTITHHRYTITVEATVAADPSCDADMESIRTTIGEPGRHLVFTGRGFGNDLDVGLGGKIQDIEFGPMPKMLSWESIGANRAAEIVWQVVVNIPKCDSPGAAANVVREVNYEMAFMIDRHGMTTRTTTGHIKISNARGPDRRPVRLVEDYLNTVLIKPIGGFERTTTRTISADRSRLDFVITDKQIPSRHAFPAMTTWASGRHRTSWKMGGGFVSNQLTVELSPKYGIAPPVAWLMFLNLLKNKLKRAEAANRPVLIDQLEAEEDVWGLPCGFSASWRIPGSVQDLLGDSGIWTPLGNDWTTWATSVADVQGWFGLAGLKANRDVIVDLCGGAMSGVPGGSVQSDNYVPGGGVTTNRKPQSQYSWLRYEMWTYPSRRRPVARQSILQPPSENEPYSSGSEPMNSTGGLQFPAKAGTPDVLQQGGNGRYSVELIGSAQRAGYEIPKPKITSLGGATPVETVTQFMCYPVANALGVPVYEAHWRICYDLPHSPGDVDTQSNLLEGIKSNGETQQPTNS